MLTCDQIREKLPALEAGESTDGATRDHLASCEPCRAEAARVRAELDTLRQDLASLAASPFLEDRVLEVARAAPGRVSEGRTGTRPSMRWAMVAGLAAAALVAAVLIAAHLPGEPAPRGLAGSDDVEEAGPGEPSGLHMPQGAQAVHAKRRKSAGRGELVDHFYAMVGAPRDGTAVVGRKVLARITLPAEQGPGAKSADTQVARAFALLTQKGTRPFIDVELRNPATGARAWVQAQVSDRYDGSLLLEEPLARALGLHRLEMAGEVTVGGDVSIRAHRTRVRLRIPAGAFDETLEIESRTMADPWAAVPLLSGGLPQQQRIEVLGERPDMGFVGTDIGMHYMHDRWFVSPDRNVPWRKEASMPLALPLESAASMQAVLEYREGAHPLCYVALPAVDFGKGGPLAWRVRLERTTLRHEFEPGAQITIARVWQGIEAVPSRESVAFTKADAKGRVSFVRVRGERGPLLVRERRGDGHVRWVRVGATDKGGLDKYLTIGVYADGTLFTGHRRYNPDTGTIKAGPKKTHPRSEVLAELRRELQRHADRAGRDKDGVSKLELVIVGYEGARWASVAEVMMAVAHPQIRMDNIRFLRAGDPEAVPYRLPRDEGLKIVDPAAPKPEKLKLFLRQREGKTLWWGLGILPPAKRQPPDTGPMLLPVAWGELEKRLHTAKPDATLEITAWSDVPYAVVQRTIGAAQARGITKVLLSGPVPR